MGDIVGELTKAEEQKKTELVFDDGHIEAMAEYKTPEELYQDLITRVRRYHPSDDISLIERAYKVANDAHKDQARKSGEPYIIHPLCVAIILADLEMDKETIAAGLLHDVVEDTIMTTDQIRAEFGDDVALLVDGVTKLGQLQYQGDKLDLQAENMRKMFLAMAKDIRVIIIKLADRLHNMRTLKHMTPEKQQEKARETMDIYAPIAQRLGIMKVKVELDDLSLKYLQPDVYYDLVDKIAVRKVERERYVQNIVDEVSAHIERAGIKAKIDGRVKHFFSIYKKMKNQNKTLDQIYDIFAVRIKVETVRDCYSALGIIHEMYKPIPGRFKDYIAMPKSNMYQSLHTTLIGPEGQPFEIQIRTFEMHRTAEYGIAAHWKYKENITGTVMQKEEEKLSWLRQILEWQRDTSDNKEFMNFVKTDLDLFAEQVYCFTPAGDVKNLPSGSTPIDFAYAIHTAVGNKMVGARINGRQVPIDTKLNNGDRVEIITSQNSAGPSRDWLNIVKSAQAKTKINQWFKHQFKDENISRGKELILAYCKSKGLDYSLYSKPEYQERVYKKYNFADWEATMAAVGHGGIKEGQVVNKLIEEYNKDHTEQPDDKEILEAYALKRTPHSSHGQGGIIVKGADDVAVRFSKCCSPVPGDEIIGFITRGRGISIHRTDCVNVLCMSEEDRNRIIDAEWQQDAVADNTYLTEINIYADDRSGILFDITKILSEANISVNSINSRTSKQGKATITISFSIKSVDQLNAIIAKIRNVDSIIDIERTVG